MKCSKWCSKEGGTLKRLTHLCLGKKWYPAFNKVSLVTVKVIEVYWGTHRAGRTIRCSIYSFAILELPWGSMTSSNFYQYSVHILFFSGTSEWYKPAGQHMSLTKWRQWQGLWGGSSHQKARGLAKLSIWMCNLLMVHIYGKLSKYSTLKQRNHLLEFILASILAKTETLVKTKMVVHMCYEDVPGNT